MSYQVWACRARIFTERAPIGGRHVIIEARIGNDIVTHLEIKTDDFLKTLMDQTSVPATKVEFPK